MIISKTKMQRIADEIGDVINKHINIMDELGVIIASTDISRIGTLHGGARRIIEEKLTQLTVDSSDNFIGAKNGINLPLFINEQCVGVVGITGSVEEVGALGSVIKKSQSRLSMSSAPLSKAQCLFIFHLIRLFV